ncbi:DNA-binding protein [Agrobacterium vitis]|uniref:HTH Mu-type domain-containing protein n=1 Tax=Agrobacterium vitis TaxID=373 RepID=A0A7K1REH5_AGRVI|nr:DNA-binding protein [Agrobacterium vitis]MVA56398.1 hypothetical protein [Agrobacterium vitis]
MTFLTAKEIADAGVRLKLRALPHTKRGVQDHIDRHNWKNLSDDLCRKRAGREGGGGYEFHISLLPEALQAALHGERVRELVTASQQATKSKEVTAREKLSTATLSARQRDVMNARSAILSAIEMHQIISGLSLRQAIYSFLADPTALDVSETILITANDRTSGKAMVSRATLYEWFKLRDTVGLGALAPLPTKEKQEVPSWFWQFLRFYAQPTKPCLTDALENYCKALPSHIMPPNYDQVRRLMARLGNVEKHRGREGSLTLKTAARSARFVLLDEPGMSVSELNANPKVQRYFQPSEFRDLFEDLFEEVSIGLHINNVTATCRVPRLLDLDRLRQALQFEFDLPYPEGRMGFADKALSIFSQRLGVSL